MRVLVRYRVKPEHLEHQLELLGTVFAELASVRPEGVRYESFRLPDGVSFVDLVETDGPGRFSALESFRRYRSTLDERCDEPPVVSELDEVGSYPEPG